MVAEDFLVLVGFASDVAVEPASQHVREVGLEEDELLLVGLTNVFVDEPS